MGELLMVSVFWMSLLCAFHCFHSMPMPCNISLIDSCAASLYLANPQSEDSEYVANLFHVNPTSVRRAVGGGFVISISCSCPANHGNYTSHMEYTVQIGDTWEIISSRFGGLVVETPEKMLIGLMTVGLDLFCGCTDGVELLTYVVKRGDTLFTLYSRFGADVNKTAELNMIKDQTLINEGDVLFIPASGLEHLTMLSDNESRPRKASQMHVHIILAIAAATTLVILIIIVIFSWTYNHKRKERVILGAPSSGIGCLDCYRMPFPLEKKKSISTIKSHSSSEEYGGSVVGSFISDKMTIFSFSETRDATLNFSASQKLGQGSYGSVYHGTLRGQDVAIKQMKNTKSKEFLAELNILCKVHHNNLIKLIGYSVGEEYLFLVYEVAQNGSLSDHLHNPAAKGHTPLSWETRIQIALDAAKGLEYIHEHIKPYYVHRDVKTSNILLDSNFRAKVADFGLVKLLENSPEIGSTTSKIVGTFGYLAPEYVRDGCVTPKTDVYAYGVVLMELITGRPALSNNTNTENVPHSGHRSVVDLILSAFADGRDTTARLVECMDPALVSFHRDSLFQMALLSKDCVDEDWKRRPDMSKVVLRLSRILVSSREPHGL
ncbi:LysM domain receptor-like kinase 3 [Acorus calamus]|uniref:LysM domain receptor-like kinase 3 n=1 Tax=Acorus calamus TaxID=4465 RepID=A0AAV9DAR4_ACOCL|nr:LysM domain receptor-like kinase 3 [Acorus calamus]